MKKCIQNYKSTFLLILSVIIGTIMGLILKERASVLKPLGDLFLNLLLLSIVPLIFLTITTTFAKIKQLKRFQKIIGRVFIVFLGTSIVAVLVGLFFTKSIPFVTSQNIEILASEKEATIENIHVLERTVQLLTTSDFYLLLSKENMVALLFFSILIGVSIRMTKEEAEPIVACLETLQKIIFNFIKLIMYYAPIGIGSYFAYLLGTFGGEIATGYLQTFLLYTLSGLFLYLVIYTLYAYMAGGITGIKVFWRHALATSLTALGTCSSAASIPINMEETKKIGVKQEIVELAIPLGTTFHKDGSILGSVFKIMFLVYLFQLDVSLPKIAFIALLATLLVTAVPIGGGTISEAFILSLLGAPLTALPMLTVIATIIDPLATMLNVVGDTLVAMLTARWVDGKHWLKKT